MKSQQVLKFSFLRGHIKFVFAFKHVHNIASDFMATTCTRITLWNMICWNMCHQFVAACSTSITSRPHHENYVCTFKSTKDITPEELNNIYRISLSSNTKIYETLSFSVSQFPLFQLPLHCKNIINCPLVYSNEQQIYSSPHFILTSTLEYVETFHCFVLQIKSIMSCKVDWVNLPLGIFS